MVEIRYPPPTRNITPQLFELKPGTTIQRIFDPTSYGATAIGFRYYGPLSRFDHLTFPVKCFGQAPSPHKDRVILTNHARELGCQWESDDDVRDSPPDKPQLRLPSQRLK